MQAMQPAGYTKDRWTALSQEESDPEAEDDKGRYATELLKQHSTPEERTNYLLDWDDILRHKRRELLVGEWEDLSIPMNITDRRRWKERERTFIHCYMTSDDCDVLNSRQKYALLIYEETGSYWRVGRALDVCSDRARKIMKLIWRIEVEVWRHWPWWEWWECMIQDLEWR